MSRNVPAGAVSFSARARISRAPASPAVASNSGQCARGNTAGGMGWCPSNDATTFSVQAAISASRWAGKGISLDFIKDETAFMGIQQDPNWRNFEKEYLAKKREFDLKINKGLKDKLAKVVERDQWFRVRGAEAFADTIMKVDRRNATELDYVFDRYGFPGEDQIGCGDGGMPIIQYPFYTVIRRQTPENQTINFSNYLMTAIRNGRITPHSATHIMATINGNDVFFARYVFKILTDEPLAMQGKSFAAKLNKWVFRQIDVTDEQRINEMRLQNGMESLAEY
eukprot:gene1418-1891_t